MIPAASASRPRLARGVRLHEDKARGWTVLLAPERVLNPSPTALQILLLCDGETSVDGIVDGLTAIYAADRQLIAVDVRSLLDDLAARKIVEL